MLLCTLCHAESLPSPCFSLNQTFQKAPFPLPSHSRLNQRKVAELGLLVTLPNFANQSWCESSCDWQQQKIQRQINQLEGTQQNTGTLVT